MELTVDTMLDISIFTVITKTCLSVERVRELTVFTPVSFIIIHVTE